MDIYKRMNSLTDDRAKFKIWKDSFPCVMWLMWLQEVLERKLIV